jgi:cytochrome b6-f complex iron-sulfur subunit
VDHMSEEQTPKRRLPEIKPVERRTFLRYSLIGSTAAGLGFFGLASLGFLWPRVGEGFGAELVVGNAQEILDEVTSERAPFRFPEGRLYVVHWDPSVGRGGAVRRGARDPRRLERADGDLPALRAPGVHGAVVPELAVVRVPVSRLALQPLGRVHRRAGAAGPGPLPVAVDDDGNLVVDTAVVLTGPSRTGNVLQQSPEGPACIDA